MGVDVDTYKHRVLTSRALPL